MPSLLSRARHFVAGNCGLALLQRGFEFDFDVVGELAHGGALLLGQLHHAA